MMTGNHHHDAGLVMPDVVAEGENPQPIAECPPARAREDTRSGGHASVAVAAAAVPRILAGSSPWFAQPPSLAADWDLHVKSARYFEFGPFRAARYTWGAAHITLAAAIELLRWSTRSFPAGLVLLGLVAAAVILL